MKKYLIPLMFAFAFAFVSCDDDEVLSHTVLSAPGSLTSSVDNGTYSINFTWNAVNGAAYYVMYYNVQGSNSFEKSGNLTDTEFTFYSEDYGTTYEFKVRAENEDAVSDFSEICTVTVPASWEVTVAAPTNVKAEFDADTGFITVTWDAVSGATSYTVYYGPEGERAYSSVPLTDTQYTISVDTYGVNYAIYVQASIGNATSPYSETVLCNVPDSAAPSVPTPVISNVREGLGWVNITLTTDVEYDYSVYDGNTLREDWGAEFIKDNGNGTMEYSIYGLELNTTYSDIRLRAVSKEDGSRSNPSMLDAVTTGNIFIPTRGSSPCHLTFEWDDAAANKNWWYQSGSDATALDRTFWIQLATDPNFTEGSLVYDLATVASSSAGTYVKGNWNGSNGDGSKAGSSPHLYAFTNAAMGKLQPSTTYYFRVRNAADETYQGASLAAANGKSAWSPAVEAKTDAAHTAPSGELLFQGFDDVCWQYDLLNNASGIIPNSSTWSVNGDYTYFLQDLGTGNRMDQIGATVSGNSAQFPYTADGLIDGCNDLYLMVDGAIPSMNGWYVSKLVFPMQGHLRIGANNEQKNVLVPPPFTDIDADTKVTISCDAGTAYVNQSEASKVWFNILRKNAGTGYFEIVESSTRWTCDKVILETNVSTADGTTAVFRPFASSNTYSWETTLQPGDYVVFECESDSNNYDRMFIDNLSVVKK